MFFAKDEIVYVYLEVLQMLLVEVHNSAATSRLRTTEARQECWLKGKHPEVGLRLSNPSKMMMLRSNCKTWNVFFFVTIL